MISSPRSWRTISLSSSFISDLQNTVGKDRMKTIFTGTLTDRHVMEMAKCYTESLSINLRLE